MNTSPFTLVEYRSLIRFAKERYTFCLFDVFDGDRKIIWRHDLEYSLHEMQKLAAIDGEEGIGSIVFVQLRSPFYNAFSSYAKRLVADWVSSGLTIGLHFDWEFFRDDLVNIEAHLRSEREKLEELSGTAITTFSYHSPSDLILRYDQDMAGMINAYHQRFMTHHNNTRYISDSNGRWRDKNLREVLGDREITKLQVNLHDTWWTDERIPQIAKLDKAFLADAAWKSRFYRDHALIVVDSIA